MSVDRAGKVELVRADPSPAEASGAVVAVPLACVAALIAVAVVAWLVRRWWSGRDPERAAFAALSRRLRLTRGEREAVVAMATRIGAPPVALLLSEHAFESAASGAAELGSTVERVRRKLIA